MYCLRGDAVRSALSGCLNELACRSAGPRTVRNGTKEHSVVAKARVDIEEIKIPRNFGVGPIGGWSNERSGHSCVCAIVKTVVEGWLTLEDTAALFIAIARGTNENGIDENGIGEVEIRDRDERLKVFRR